MLNIQDATQVKVVVGAAGVSTAQILELVNDWVGVLGAVAAIIVSITLAIKNINDSKKIRQEAESIRIENERERIELEAYKRAEEQRIAAAKNTPCRRGDDPREGL